MSPEVGCATLPPPLAPLFGRIETHTAGRVQLPSTPRSRLWTHTRAGVGNVGGTSGPGQPRTLPYGGIGPWTSDWHSSRGEGGGDFRSVRAWTPRGQDWGRLSVAGQWQRTDFGRAAQDIWRKREAELVELWAPKHSRRRSGLWGRTFGHLGLWRSGLCDLGCGARGESWTDDRRF
jgi:hypothetical protein